jgi:hypothetical protein
MSRRRRAAVPLVAFATSVLTVACGSAATHGGAGPTAGPTAGPAQSWSLPPPAGHSGLRYQYAVGLSDGGVARRYGYNLVDTGPSRAAIDALPAGVRALVWLGNYSLQTCRFGRPDAVVRQQVGRLANDPKVAGYYIADEPDDGLPAYGGHCPDVVAQVSARNRLIHQLAPGAFTYEVVTEPGNFAAFAHASDVMGADPYPCLRGRPCDWSKIPAYIAALRAAGVRHYWGVLQAFSFHDWRFPTPAELTRMIRQWQRSGWQGEQTYLWSDGVNGLASQPGLLAVLGQLNTGQLAPTGPAGVG